MKSTSQMMGSNFRVMGRDRLAFAVILKYWGQWSKKNSASNQDMIAMILISQTKKIVE